MFKCIDLKQKATIDAHHIRKKGSLLTLACRWCRRCMKGKRDVVVHCDAYEKYVVVQCRWPEGKLSKKPRQRRERWWMLQWKSREHEENSELLFLFSYSFLFYSSFNNKRLSPQIYLLPHKYIFLSESSLKNLTF